MVEDLNAMVPLIGYVHPIVGVERDGNRIDELAGLAALTADRQEVAARVRKHPNSVIAPVRHVEAPIAADGDIARIGELSTDHPPSTDFRERRPRGPEDLHPIRARVRDVEVAGRVGRDAVRIEQLTRPVALLAESTRKLPAFLEHECGVREVVHDDEPVSGIDVDAEGPEKAHGIG